MRLLGAELDQAACNRARLTRDARFDGRLFIGVVSTGVYCRPICPSPTAKPRNVRYFSSAAAAVDAGFRPCLRCRPEAAPGTPAWNGTSATVSRALRLIAEGALDGHSVETLSERLGVSSRHLHRLFLLHLGASPVAVAHTRRLHFAKQLVTDTGLSMAEVAGAAGFPSVRRFNDTFRRVYDRTPSEIRGLRPTGVPSEPGEYIFRLAYRPPYDWGSLLGFLSARATPGVEEVVAGSYRRSFKLHGQQGILEVRHAGRGDALEAHIWFPDPLSLLPIVTRVRAMFDLAAEPSAIARHLSRDPLLAPLVKRHPGLRVPGAWDGFELAVRAILGQQVTVAAASTLAGRLARRFGEPLVTARRGGLSLVFPDAGALADARLTGLPRARAGAIRLLAQAVVSGDVAFAGRAASSPASLARIRGIGDWTTQYVAMRAFNEPDAFPVGDLALLRAAGRHGPLTPDKLKRRAAGWRPWRAYAAMYLWRAGTPTDPPGRDRRASRGAAAGPGVRP